MASHGSASFQRHFQDLQDPRVERTRKHPLINIVFMAVCGVLSGANSFAAIHEFAIDRRNWLAGYLDLTHGIPSEDTFAFLARLDPGAFEKCLLSWVQAVQEVTDHRMVAIDGETMPRFVRSRDRTGSHPHGLGVGHGEQTVAGSGCGRREIQRDHGDSGTPPGTGDLRGIGDDRCDGLPEERSPTRSASERPTSSWPSSRTSRRSMSRSRERSTRPWNRTPRTSMSTRPSRRDMAAGRPGRTPSFRTESVDPEDLWHDLSAGVTRSRNGWTRKDDTAWRLVTASSAGW